ncbi:hypothetical protein Q5M85_16020 [Paraclostridium bifermentans]|nr:hypothetical protein [Paraclostridium bifermentans]
MKNNKLYVKLIIVMTILIASIGMVLSYQSIKSIVIILDIIYMKIMMISQES